MALLIGYLVLALGVSFLCSILEATLLSLTPTYLRSLETTKPLTAKRWADFKNEVEKPLAAILSLNTIAHTVGAAGAGAQAVALFGDFYFGVISAILTLLILFVSEIVPKTLGARYFSQLAAPAAVVLQGVQIIMYPLVLVTQKLTKRLLPDTKPPTLSRSDLSSLIDIGEKEGILDKNEAKSIASMMAFRELDVESVMTPRTVVFMLDEDLTIEEILKTQPTIRYSRLPLYRETKDDVVGFVRKDDLYQYAASGKKETRLSQIKRSMLTVPDTKKVPDLLQQMVSERAQIVHVVNEYGDSLGIATMEDLVETMIGMEIVDESDTYIDMQERARLLWRQRSRRMNEIQDGG